MRFHAPAHENCWNGISCVNVAGYSGSLTHLYIFMDATNNMDTCNSSLMQQIILEMNCGTENNTLFLNKMVSTSLCLGVEKPSLGGF